MCKELGFSVVIPPGSVNYAVTVSVCCSFQQQLQPPGGYEFVSPVYVLHVTAGITFLEEVELSLNHWAKLSSDSSLAFALTPIPFGDSPCVLQPQDGGQFFHRHGIIKTKHFSVGAVLRRVKRALLSPFQCFTSHHLERRARGERNIECENDEVVLCCDKIVSCVCILREPVYFTQTATVWGKETTMWPHMSIH